MRASKLLSATVAASLLTFLIAAGVSRAEAQAPSGNMFIKPPSASAPPPSPDPRNFEGTYYGAMLDFGGVPPGGAPPGGAPPGGAPPGAGAPPSAGGRGVPTARPMDVQYTPKAQVRIKRRTELQKQELEEPNPAFFCRPYAHIRNIAQPVFPAKVVQTKNRVVFLTEEGRSVWEIFLDRDHPKGQALVPTYNGHSIGHWEGDTLVVDVLGFNGKSSLDLMAGPNSTQTHLQAWIRKTEGGKLEVKYQLEDPDVYVGKPPVVSSTLLWNPELHLAEFSCEESIGIGTFPSQRGAGYEDTDFSKLNEKN
jgi:hypothetical protein